MCRILLVGSDGAKNGKRDQTVEASVIARFPVPWLEALTSLLGREIQNGSHLQIRGRTTTSLVKVSIKELPDGSPKVTFSPSGKQPVPSCGFMENVCPSVSVHTVGETDDTTAGSGKSVLRYVNHPVFPLRRSYFLHKLRHHPRCRREPQRRISLNGILLLRFQGRRKADPAQLAFILACSTL
jgi:hypothetical protein